MKKDLLQSLKFKLTLSLILFALIPVVAVSSIIVKTMERDSIKDKHINVNQQLSLINSQVDLFFNDIIDNITFLSNTDKLKNVDDTITSYMGSTADVQMTPSQNGPVEQGVYRLFDALAQAHPAYQYLYVGTKTGGYVQYPEARTSGAWDPRDRPWYKIAMDNPGETVIGTPYLYEVDNITLVSVSRTVTNNSGEIIGVVGLDVSLELLNQMFTEASKDNDVAFLFVSDDGTILADPDNPEAVSKNHAEIYGHESFQDIVSLVDFKKSQIDGETYFTTSVQSDATGWYYLATVLESDILKLSRALGNFTLIMLAIALAVSTAAGILLSRGISNPILAVIKVSDKIAGGDFDVAVDVKAQGEVGLLVDSFKKIGATLKEYKQYIEEISSVLNQVADGDMTFELESDYIGEFSAIKTALLHISQTLTETLTQIKISSDHIADGASQVSSVAQSLS